MIDMIDGEAEQWCNVMLDDLIGTLTNFENTFPNKFHLLHTEYISFSGFDFRR